MVAFFDLESKTDREKMIERLTEYRDQLEREEPGEIEINEEFNTIYNLINHIKHIGYDRNQRNLQNEQTIESFRTWLKEAKAELAGDEQFSEADAADFNRQKIEVLDGLTNVYKRIDALISENRDGETEPHFQERDRLLERLQEITKAQVDAAFSERRETEVALAFSEARRSLGFADDDLPMADWQRKHAKWIEGRRKIRNRLADVNKEIMDGLSNNISIEAMRKLDEKRDKILAELRAYKKRKPKAEYADDVDAAFAEARKALGFVDDSTPGTGFAEGDALAQAEAFAESFGDSTSDEAIAAHMKAARLRMGYRE